MFSQYVQVISPVIYISAFNQIKDTYSTSISIFADGSNEDNKVALAVIQCKSHSEKLPYNTSIYIAELISTTVHEKYYTIITSFTFTNHCSKIH